LVDTAEDEVTNCRLAIGIDRAESVQGQMNTAGRGERVAAVPRAVDSVVAVNVRVDAQAIRGIADGVQADVGGVAALRDVGALGVARVTSVHGARVVVVAVLGREDAVTARSIAHAGEALVRGRAGLRDIPAGRGRRDVGAEAEGARCRQRGAVDGASRDAARDVDRRPRERVAIIIAVLARGDVGARIGRGELGDDRAPSGRFDANGIEAVGRTGTGQRRMLDLVVDAREHVANASGLGLELLLADVDSAVADVVVAVVARGVVAVGGELALVRNGAAGVGAARAVGILRGAVVLIH